MTTNQPDSKTLEQRRNNQARVYALNCDESMSLEDHCTDAFKSGFDASTAIHAEEIERLRKICTDQRTEFESEHTASDKKITALLTELRALRSALSEISYRYDTDHVGAENYKDEGVIWLQQMVEEKRAEGEKALKRLDEFLKGFGE